MKEPIPLWEHLNSVYPGSVRVEHEDDYKRVVLDIPGRPLYKTTFCFGDEYSDEEILNDGMVVRWLKDITGYRKVIRWEKISQ